MIGRHSFLYTLKINHSLLAPLFIGVKLLEGYAEVERKGDEGKQGGREGRRLRRRKGYVRGKREEGKEEGWREERRKGEEMPANGRK